MLFRHKNEHTPTLEVPPHDQSADQVPHLESLLTEVPQYEAGNPDPRYLLAAGMAVQLTTGYKRPHGDVDVQIMRGPTHPFDERDIDRETPHSFWGDTKFDPDFLHATRVTAYTRPGYPDGLFVDCINPAILMVQKVTDRYAPPREKDFADARAIGANLQAAAGRNAGDVPVRDILRVALDAVAPDVRDITEARVNDILRQSPKLPD